MNEIKASIAYTMMLLEPDTRYTLFSVSMASTMVRMLGTYRNLNTA